MNRLTAITPQELIESYGVDGLCRTADDYYRSITDWNFLLAKPFSNSHVASYLMARLGTLLSGMRLAPGMTILDFGAGTCWVSRILAQMGCNAIALDPSATALEIGKEMCQRLPLIGPMAVPPDFKVFDGHRIPVPDESVDRIICFDAFHHVPNIKEMLSEFGRITKPGAIIGMCEPIGNHSSSGSSQHEMSIHKVLENDLSIDDIYESLKTVGFNQAQLRVIHSDQFYINLEDRKSLLRKKGLFRSNRLERRIVSDAKNVITNLGIVHFSKGSFVLDSRFPEGLFAEINIRRRDYSLCQGDALHFELEVKNVGDSIWLHATNHHRHHGRVQVGFNLYDSAFNLVSQGYHACPFERDVKPGESVKLNACLPSLPKGQHHVEIDLFSNEVAWFKQGGSQTVTLNVTVE